MTNESPADSQSTTCCIVGGGPAGVVLSLLLARKGVPVTLLEAHLDFDRDFRGDTVHPSTLELLDQIGLGEKVQALPHRKLRGIGIVTRAGRTPLLDLTQLKSKYPYIQITPQSELLNLLVEEAKKYPSFRLVLGANVQRLVEEGGAVKGVLYQGADSAWHEVRALLTVGADGRFSKLRKLAGFEPIKSSAPMDVVWFRLPRKPADENADLADSFFIGQGHLVVLLERPDDQWQVGFVILKGSFAQTRSQGLGELRQSLAQIVPALADRVDHLQDFRQVAVLSVESSYLTRWHKPGLLLIGDAAHVMTPVGGIGIQYAVQDAVEAANQLTEPLRQGSVTEKQLASVQRHRLTAARRAQHFQNFMQKNIVTQALNPDQPFRLPLALRFLQKIPGLRDLPANFIGNGFCPSRLAEPRT